MVVTILIGGLVGAAITLDVLTVSQAAIAAGVAIVVWFVGYMAVATFHVKRFNADSVTMMAMLGRGEHDKAAELCAGWARGVTVPAVITSAARHNIAWATLRKGQLNEARALFSTNELANARWLKANQMYSVSALDRALCSALLGELDQARRALDDAETRALRAHLSYAAMRAFVDAVIACRDGRAAEAAKALADRWTEYETMTTGDVLRPLRVVRAFALAQEGPRNAGQVETMISAVRPAYPTEYAFLAVSWPEMAAFLASHGL